MNIKIEVDNIIKQAVEELNEQTEKEILFAPETCLIGSHAEISSIDFVTLVSIIEELISDKFGKDIRIVSDKAFSREHSPFHSVKTLTDFIVELLEAKPY